MHTHRGGERAVVCEGCWNVIENYRPQVHNIVIDGERGHHACSVKCARKAKERGLPDERFCVQEDCGLRVATGAPLCAADHPQPRGMQEANEQVTVTR